MKKHPTNPGFMMMIPGQNDIHGVYLILSKVGKKITWLYHERDGLRIVLGLLVTDKQPILLPDGQGFDPPLNTE